MIISKTPFRISFFGGGTDYPVWYRENAAAVLATTIDKFCYISCRYLPPFFDHKYRIVYSKVENVGSLEEIQHPAVRAVAQYIGVEEGLEVHHDGDLPARTGLGSSSSFTVGMLHALHAYQGMMPTKKRLASEAIHIERDVLKENVGSQDQVLAAVGGFHKVYFTPDDDFQITPVTIGKERLERLQSRLMLYFTGTRRYASEIAKEQIKETPNKKNELTAMYKLVEEALAVLSGDGDVVEFGRLLHESWQLKRSLTSSISNPRIDEIYEAARSAGAIGGKLLGAGGGGFMLIFARPKDQFRIDEALQGLLRVPFKFETQGSQIVVYEPDITPRY